jgi:hypothetical protein
MSQLDRYARKQQERVDRAVAKETESDDDDSDGRRRSSKKRNRKNNEKPKSWTYDEEYPNLIVPLPAFSEEGADEEKYRDLKFQKRKQDFLDEKLKQDEFALSRKKQREDEVEFDDEQALLGTEKPEEPEELPVIERDFSADAIRFDYETGKIVVTRPIKPRWFSDYNLFAPDDTIVLNGRRRTGKSFFARKILYEMRHMFQGGLVFSATKHNGTDLRFRNRLTPPSEFAYTATLGRTIHCVARFTHTITQFQHAFELGRMPQIEDNMTHFSDILFAPFTCVAHPFRLLATMRPRSIHP